MDETQVWLRAGWPPTDRGLVGGKPCDGRLAKAMMQIVEQMHKGRYHGKRAKIDTRVICTKVVWGTADGKSILND